MMSQSRQLWTPGSPGPWLPNSPSPGETQALNPKERDWGEGLRVHQGCPGAGRGLGEGVQARPHVCSSRRQLFSEAGELAGLQLCASRRSCSTCSSWASRSSGAEGRCSLRAEQAGPRLPELVPKVRGSLEVGLRSPTYSILSGAQTTERVQVERTYLHPGL